MIIECDRGGKKWFEKDRGIAEKNKNRFSVENCSNRIDRDDRDLFYTFQAKKKSIFRHRSLRRIDRNNRE